MENKYIKTAEDGFNIIRFIAYYIIVIPIVTVILLPFAILGKGKDLISKGWKDWKQNDPGK